MNENDSFDSTEKHFPSAKRLEVSDPGQILELCCSLVERSSAELQTKINIYVNIPPLNNIVKCFQSYPYNL